MSSAAAHSLVAGEQGREPRLDERELVRELRAAFEAHQNEAAEELFASLSEDTQRALPEMLRVELESRRRTYLIGVLDKADWFGPQYVVARNTYLLDLYRDELPDDATDVSVFVRAQPLVADLPEERIAGLSTMLSSEFEA